MTDILNAAGAAITSPSEILHTLRILTTNSEVRAILGAEPK